METPASKDTGQPPEYSIRWFEDLCFRNIRSSITHKAALEWSSKLDVAHDIELSFQQSFLKNTFGKPDYSQPLNASEEVALKSFKDSKTPGEIATEADRIANRLEKYIQDGTVDQEDVPAFDRKITAAKSTWQYFTDEQQRRAQTSKK